MLYKILFKKILLNAKVFYLKYLYNFFNIFISNFVYIKDII